MGTLGEKMRWRGGVIYLEVPLSLESKPWLSKLEELSSLNLQNSRFKNSNILALPAPLTNKNKNQDKKHCMYWHTI